MNRLNWLFTFSSLNVLLVTIERYSFTTKVLLQPDSFLRLHEVFQMTFIILLTVILPFLLLKEISGNFKLLKNPKGFYLLLTFIIGIYFYATGNGVHELASFQFNHYCDTKSFGGDLCGGFFFNDYYFGNILYFFGGILMNLPLLMLERTKQYFKFNKKELIILTVNAVVYGLAIFAYSGFDRVLVGLTYSTILMILACYYLFTSKKSFNKLPVTLSLAICYSLGTIGAVLVRIF